MPVFADLPVKMISPPVEFEKGDSELCGIKVVRGWPRGVSSHRNASFGVAVRHL